MKDREDRVDGSWRRMTCMLLVVVVVESREKGDGSETLIIH